MRWLRSFPARIPEGRSYIVDRMERLLLDNYDYSPLESVDEDVCLLEWDMAADVIQRETFEYYAEQYPYYVLVAPYRLWHLPSIPEPYQAVWAHRCMTDR